MPILLNVVKTKGWRTKKPDERGEIVVMQFIEEKQRKLMFEYAPKWQDMEALINLLEVLFNNELNKLHLKNHGLKTFEKEYTDKVLQREEKKNA